MTYVAIMKWAKDGTVAAVAEFSDRDVAVAHVEKFVERFPDAFVTERPSGDPEEWEASAGQLRFSAERSAKRNKELHEDFQAALRAPTLEDRIKDLEAKLAAMEARSASA